MLDSAAAVICRVEFLEEYFICSGCHQKVLVDRVFSESIFSGFKLELQAFQGYTGEVMRDFIVPMTNGSRCRFVELEVMLKSGVVGSGRGDDVYQLL